MQDLTGAPVGAHLSRWPFFRANAGRWRPDRTWESPAAGLAVVPRGDAPLLVGVGEPGPLADLIASVDPGPVGHVMLTRGTWQRTPGEARDRLGYRPGRCWEWMCTSVAPPAAPGERHVAEITGPDRLGRVHAVLARAYPDRGRHPGDAEVTWWGYRAGDDLAGVVGTVPPGGTPGAGVNLQALAVLPEYRRRGVAGAMTAALTRWGLARGPLVHLGIWSDNDSARRLYTRLGYRTEHHVENLHPSP